jgi:uncharacterized membrane protein
MQVFMDFLAANWKGILAATVAAMIIGSIWYARPVFGKQWQKLVGLKDSDMKKGMAKGMIIMLIVALVTAVVLARFVVIANPQSYMQALKLGFWIWLGFVATYAIGGGVFEKRAPMLMAINLGNSLVTLLVMSAIIYGLR